MNDTPQPNHGPVTYIVTRRVKPGCEAEYETWLAGINREALQFPGHLGINVIKPADRAHPEYVILFRFDCYANLRRCEESDVRREWLARSNHLTEGEPQFQRVTGLEVWFTPPPGQARLRDTRWRS